jgi:hypothetical protein
MDADETTVPMTRRGAIPTNMISYKGAWAIDSLPVHPTHSSSVSQGERYPRGSIQRR